MSDPLTTTELADQALAADRALRAYEQRLERERIFALVATNDAIPRAAELRCAARLQLARAAGLTAPWRTIIAEDFA